jgi:hypothetical protein
MNVRSFIRQLSSRTYLLDWHPTRCSFFISNQIGLLVTTHYNITPSRIGMHSRLRTGLPLPHSRASGRAYVTTIDRSEVHCCTVVSMAQRISRSTIISVADDNHAYPPPHPHTYTHTHIHTLTHLPSAHMLQVIDDLYEELAVDDEKKARR